MKHQLVWVEEHEDEEVYEYLSTTKHWKVGGEVGDRTIVRLADDAPLSDIAEYLDGEAESKNYHEFVGVYMWLAVAISKFCGEDNAEKIMRLIAEYDGLVDLVDDPDANREIGL